MSGSSKTSDALPSETSASEALENAVEESRREYDKKVETMEEIDDKAMRSVRTAVILLGLVVSAVSVSGPGAVGQFPILPVLLSALGVSALAVSIVYGIGAYTVTQYPTGIGSSHRNDVVEGEYGKSEWLVEIITEYEEWSDEITAEIEYSLQYLEISQTSLLAGVVFLIVSSITIVMRTAYGVRPLITFASILTTLFAARTYLGYRD